MINKIIQFLFYIGQVQGGMILYIDKNDNEKFYSYNLCGHDVASFAKEIANISKYIQKEEKNN